MSIYIRNLKENVILVNHKVRISSFIPIGMKEVIFERVPENNYILGVCYRIGDSQICMSGHPKIDEDINEGAMRELREELSLVTDSLETCKKIRENSFYTIDIKNSFIEKNNFLNRKSDKRERAVICVHGEEKEILHYLANVSYNEINEDNISSIWACSREKIINYLCDENRSMYLF